MGTIKAILRKTLIFTDIEGKRHMVQKGQAIDIGRIGHGSFYTDGKGMLNVQKGDKFIAMLKDGAAVDILPDEFKTID